MIAPVVLFLTPAETPVTLRIIAHELPPNTVPPKRVITPEFGTAVRVPLQVFVATGGFATCRPAGKVSVNATPLSAVVPFGLSIVKLNCWMPFSGMVGVGNPFVMVGGATTTIFAVEVFPAPPSLEVTAPVVLLLIPKLVPVTFTDKVHEPLSGTVPPLRLTEVALAAALNVPPQLFVGVGLLTTCNPLGRGSVKPTPVRDVEEFELPMVKLSEVLPFRGIDAAPKVLLMLGGNATVRFAEAVLPVPPLVEVTLPVVLR